MNDPVTAVTRWTVPQGCKRYFLHPKESFPRNRTLVGPLAKAQKTIFYSDALSFSPVPKNPRGAQGRREHSALQVILRVTAPS